MNQPMTREQVEHVADSMTEKDWLEHDASQRALLRQREEELALAVEQARSQERTYWKQQLAAMTEERDDIAIRWKNNFELRCDVEQQLAASQARCAELLQELRNIAQADTRTWDDPNDFEAWARNRARGQQAVCHHARAADDPADTEDGAGTGE